MHLWIIRHGKAEPLDDDHTTSRDDWTRRLVARGHRQAEFLARHLAAHPLTPHRLLSSPVTRAAQTARLVNATLTLSIAWAAELETDRPTSAAIALIESQPASLTALAIVGHNNQLSDLCNTIIGPRGPASELATGEAVLVSLDRATPRGSGAIISRTRLDE